MNDCDKNGGDYYYYYYYYYYVALATIISGNFAQLLSHCQLKLPKL